MSFTDYPLRIFVGWNSREQDAYEVCKHTLQKHSSIPLDIRPIKQQELRDQGVYWRTLDAMSSTEFSLTRFLVPHLAQYYGWAVFMDCDFMWRKGIDPILDYLDPKYSVVLVKHNYNPKEITKMNGALQFQYPRKNWSSLMVINCGHPSVVGNLGLIYVNESPPAYLHQIRWAPDVEIGELPLEFNYLEGWSTREQCPDPAAVHFTRGGPWFEGLENVEYAEEWNQCKKDMAST